MGQPIWWPDDQLLAWASSVLAFSFFVVLPISRILRRARVSQWWLLLALPVPLGLRVMLSCMVTACHPWLR